jgi:hypothetical protein
MTDNRQTTRTFQCREALWGCFEQMARELECSVDYLLNDAMKQYARQRGYNSTGPDSLAPLVASSAPPPPLRSPAGRAPLPPITNSAAPLPPIPMPGGNRQSPPSYASRAPTGGLPPPAPRRPTPAPLPPPPATRLQAPSAQPGYYPSSVPPHQGFQQDMPMPAPSGRPQVNIYYMGERYPVTKDRFIIGRGRQSSDLTIKDPNVSRQHAMVEYLNGYYYIVDMGSTNGVEYAGQRIQRRVVGEGDSFKVCDHELRFSYH